VPATLPSHRESKLRNAANTYRDDHDRSRERCDEERDGNGHSPADREEVNAHVTGVLSNEVNERHAKDDGHDDADPGGRDSCVTEVFAGGLRIATVRRGRLRYLFIRLLAIVLGHVNLSLPQSEPV
jgi:hypothetical protein